MIAAASLAARAVTIDPDQADYYRGLGEDLFSRWEDVTGEDYRSVDMGIKRTESCLATLGTRLRPTTSDGGPCRAWSTLTPSRRPRTSGASAGSGSNSHFE